jgi:outer membrane protein TolC
MTLGWVRSQRMRKRRRGVLGWGVLGFGLSMAMPAPVVRAQGESRVPAAPATPPSPATTAPTAATRAPAALRSPLSGAVLPRETPLPLARVQSLQEAIRLALLRNTNAELAAAEIERAEAVARETRAGWLPTLYGNAVYTRLDRERRFGDRVIAGVNQLSANLTLTVPLVAPQKWAAHSRVKDQVELSRASREDVRQKVALATARAYLLVVSQKRVLEVNESARTTAQAHYDYARTRFQGGIGNRVNMVRAEQEMATVQGVAETARTALVRAREALGVLIGAPGAVDAVEPSLAAAPPLARALGEAEERRRDVQALKQRLRAARHSESLNYADYLPYLVALFVPFYQDPPTLSTPLTGWQAQLALTLPLYDGGLRYGLADERAAATRAAEANLEGVLRQARSEVRTAFDAALRAESGLNAARRAARLADEALALATVAYHAGATSNLEVIDAERRARDAAIQVAMAEDTLRQAKLDLLAASGRFP